MMRRTRLFAVLTAVVATLALTGNTAQAQVVKPFKIRGAGPAPEGLSPPGGAAIPHSIEGTATHLGRHTGSGTEQTDAAFAIDPMTGVISGTFGSGSAPFTFTGADGDTLVCFYGRTAHGASTPGTFELVPVGPPGVYVAFFLAEFVAQPTLSTGKFAGVTGSWPMYAVSDPLILDFSNLTTSAFDYSWQGHGHLTFPQ